MSKSPITAEGFNLHMQWIDQFVRESEASSLTADEKTYIRIQAGRYICCVREQVNLLAARWLH